MRRQDVPESSASIYGETVNGKVLGSNSPVSGPSDGKAKTTPGASEPTP